LLTKYGSRGCNAVGCANKNEHRPTNTRSSFSAPEAVLSEVEQRFDCVQAQTHMYPSLVFFFLELDASKRQGHFVSFCCLRSMLIKFVLLLHHLIHDLCLRVSSILTL